MAGALADGALGINCSQLVFPGDKGLAFCARAVNPWLGAAPGLAHSLLMA
jgi:hypothetical protein